MKLQVLLDSLKVKQNGSWFKVRWLTNLDRYMCAACKKSGQIVTKEVTTTVRKGIEYANIKHVREELIAKGNYTIDPQTGEVMVFPDSLRWGEYVEGYEGLLIKHKDKFYVRFYTSPNRAKVTYFLNGEEVTKEELREKQILINSYWTKDSVEDCMTVTVDNIQEVY